MHGQAKARNKSTATALPGSSDGSLAPGSPGSPLKKKKKGMASGSAAPGAPAGDAPVKATGTGKKRGTGKKKGASAAQGMPEGMAPPAAGAGPLGGSASGARVSSMPMKRKKSKSPEKKLFSAVRRA